MNKGFDELGEALIPESATDDSLSFRNVVVFPEGNGVAVGIRDEGEGRRDEVRLGVAHEVLARNVELGTFRKIRGRIQQGKQNSAGRPGELVSQRVPGALGGRETTAVREEFFDLYKCQTILSCEVNMRPPFHLFHEPRQSS